MKTIKDLTIEELNNVVTDLEKGVRYNDIKAKYNLANNAVNANTITECKKLIAELTPAPEPEERDSLKLLAHVSNQTEEQKEELLRYGATINKGGYYVF